MWLFLLFSLTCLTSDLRSGSEPTYLVRTFRTRVLTPVALATLPPEKSVVPVWSGSQPATADAPSWRWSAPAGSTWGWGPPGLTSAQHGGRRRVRNQKTRPSDPSSGFPDTSISLETWGGAQSHPFPILPHTCLRLILRMPNPAIPHDPRESIC